MMNAIYIRPAYGKKYFSKEQVLEDWNANKDFMTLDTKQYISKSDFSNYGNPLDYLYFMSQTVNVVIYYEKTT